MGNHRGRHRAAESTLSGRLRAGAARMRAAVPAAGVAGIAVAGVAALGSTPVLSAAPDLMATQAYYIRGTNIGTVPPDNVYAAWADEVIDDTAGAHQAAQKVPYPGGFWPVSKGFLSDPTYNKSVAQGVASLNSLVGNQTGVIIYGYSQGAVVATDYKRGHDGVGNTYVLVANPNRPNGGILQRYNGLTIPILDISFNGSTPTNGDVVYDIARQYDGWADFPTYPLNLLATANAMMGILYLHGKYDADIDPAVLEDPTKTDKQVFGNTTYYLIHTDRLPLLMPLDGILSDSFLDKLDAPLRAMIERGYDRTNYGEPTKAGLFPKPSQVAHLTGTPDHLGSVAQKVADDLAGAATPKPEKTKDAAPQQLTDPAPTGSGEPAAPPVRKRSTGPRHATTTVTAGADTDSPSASGSPSADKPDRPGHGSGTANPHRTKTDKADKTGRASADSAA